MSIWARRSSGMARRPALYSTYSWERNVGLPRSNAAIAYSGRDASTMASIDVKPYTAFVTRPSEVLMGGRAKKAREMRMRASIKTRRPRLPFATVEAYVRRQRHPEEAWSDNIARM